MNHDENNQAAGCGCLLAILASTIVYFTVTAPWPKIGWIMSAGCLITGLIMQGSNSAEDRKNGIYFILIDIVTTLVLSCIYNRTAFWWILIGGTVGFVLLMIIGTIINKRAERREQEQKAFERMRQEQMERERLEKERMEEEKQIREQMERERLERERIKQERMEQQRLEQKRLEEEINERKKLQKEKEIDIIYNHPLKETLDGTKKDKYLTGQLIIFKRIPQKNNDPSTLKQFASSLGITGEIFEDIFNSVLSFDNSVTQELLEELPHILNENETTIFLYDIVRLQGKNCKMEGEFLKYWHEIATGLFHLDNDSTEKLKKLCSCISDDCFIWSQILGDDYYLIRKEPYLVINLQCKARSYMYTCRWSNEAPDLSNEACRTKELWLKRIPADTFIMGSPKNELGRYDLEETQHSVTLTKDFFIGIFPVTQQQWNLVMEANPSTFSDSGLDVPVENITYDMICGEKRSWPMLDIIKTPPLNSSFLGKLRLRTGMLGLDLPTEAQWEYACRARTTAALHNGKELTTENGECPNLDEIAWYKGNSEGITHPVGQKKPNTWGLYDMLGNVWEWCRDWYGDYPRNSIIDPVGLVSNNPDSKRVLRGGSIAEEPSACRSSTRTSLLPSEHPKDNFHGFRLALVPLQ